jgi:hypothetical protein
MAERSDTVRNCGGPASGATDEAARRDPAVDALVARLGDRIDDRVAEAFDDQLADRLAEPGLLGCAAARDRRTGPAVVLGSAAIGAAAIPWAADGTLAALASWTGLALLNAVYFLRRT